MAYTKRELATDVLRSMGLVPSDDSPSQTDLTFVMRRYDAKLEEWRDRKLVYWSNPDETSAVIPSAIYEPLQILIISSIALSFGKPELMGNEEMLLKPIRRHVARGPTGLPMKADYF